MSEQSTEPESRGAGTAPANKKRYTTPHLRTYGDVRVLTATNASFTNFPTDGGIAPNIYNS